MSTQDINQSSTRFPSEINLLDQAIIIAKHKKLILWTTSVVSLTALVISMLLPKIYTATATMLPPNKMHLTAGALAGLGAMVGGGEGFGLKNPGELYITMLKSRTIADRLIGQFGLLKVYDKKYMQDARKELEKRSLIAEAKGGVITINYDDKDPIRAAAVANAYISELNKLASSLAITEASQRRLFFEQQLNQIKEKLARSEIELQKLQVKTGLIRDYPIEKEIAASNAQLRAEIATKEVQLAAMQISVTQNNPEYLRVKSALESLKRRLNGQVGRAEDDPMASEKGETYIEKYREVEYNKELMGQLFKEYELAKIDEAKDYPVIQMLDAATPPEKKSKPKRSLIILVAIILGLIMSTIAAFLIEASKKMRREPQYAAKLEQLRKHGFNAG